jgi:hypothetical protein
VHSGGSAPDAGIARPAGAAIAARKRAQRQWDDAIRDQGQDLEHFRREILPGFAEVKLVDIMAAAGISKAFASRIRAGKFAPHASTWHDLARVAGTNDVGPELRPEKA